MATYFAESGVIGANLDAVHTTAKFPVGTRVTGQNNQVWVYGKAAAALTAYKFVGLDQDHNAAVLSTTTAATTVTVGIPQRAFAASDYGWFVINGSNVYGLIDGTEDVNPGAQFAVSGVAAGLLAVWSISTQRLVAGVLTVTTASGTTVTTEVVLNNPHIIAPRA